MSSSIRSAISDPQTTPAGGAVRRSYDRKAQFADRVRIHVTAGRGGDGSRSFRREAHVPRGGPDGGDGGRGGDVILVAQAGLTSLADLRRSPHQRAKPGGSGAGSRAHGRNGTRRVIPVPLGTVARTEPEGAWIGEVLEHGDRLVIARGGRGGRGNVHFASATHRVPQHAEKGDPGETGWVQLELKVIADIGLVGAPNAGKSTLLAALTDARPEVGAYPFTTTSPNLGALDFEDGTEHRILVADVPGLIRGAHSGHGLGHEFLRHVERTRALVGVVDGMAEDPVAEWQAVRAELELHDPALLDRPRLLVVSKQDEPDARAVWARIRKALEKTGERPIAVSAHDGTGLDALRTELTALLAEARVREQAASETTADQTIHRFEKSSTDWDIVAEGGDLRVRGRAIETAAARIDFENEESRQRFQARLERLGIDAALRERGAGPGTIVHIGPLELEWGDEE